MKRYKIVQHFQNDSDHMFRIYKRTWYFGWEWITSYCDVKTCEMYIAQREAEEREQRAIIKNTPKAKVVKYIG